MLGGRLSKNVLQAVCAIDSNLNHHRLMGEPARPGPVTLEALKGDLAGRHSIRINDQWRVVFRWTDAGPEDVEIIDYH